MQQECGSLKIKPLDQTNQEIIIDIKRSKDEIKGLKKSFRSLKRSHIDMQKSNESLRKTNKKVKKSFELLQKDHKKVEESNELLKEDHKKMTKEMEKLKIFQQDTVPWNIRGKQSEEYIYIVILVRDFL